MNQCVFCNTSDNLNTQFTITLDDSQKVVVFICDVHAEDATVKTAKAAYMDMQAKIDAVMAQAKALGLTLAPPTKSGLVVASAPPTLVAPASPAQPTPVLSESMNVDDPNVISTERLDRRSGGASVGGNADGFRVDSFQSYSTDGLQDKLPESARKGYARMDTVVGRDGQPIAIPVERVDGTGSTKIRVRQAVNDASMQRMFKNMATNSLQDNAPDFAKAGYRDTIRQCPICHGSGVAANKPCPKCNGSGEIVIM